MLICLHAFTLFQPVVIERNKVKDASFTEVSRRFHVIMFYQQKK